jgi:FKBP-type peptidyl-prolyl cis-trans isomerase
MKNSFLLVLLAALIISSCSTTPEGYSELAPDHFMKLLVLGDDHQESMNTAYYGLDITLFPDSTGRSQTFLLVHPEELYRYFNQNEVLKEINEMKQNQIMRFIVPGKTVAALYVGDSTAFAARAQVECEVKMEKRFSSSENTCTYFMHKAQEGMISELDAIKLCQGTTNRTWEDYGKVSFSWIRRSEGDSVKAGRDIVVQYNTYWLDGTRKDTLTAMALNFGKPGQLVQGMQYALSLMKAGERALVYMPSELAFGESGSSTGIIPPRTPIYFDINVLEVKIND